MAHSRPEPGWLSVSHMPGSQHLLLSAQAPRGHPVLLGKLVTTSMGLRLKLCPGQGSAACQRYPPLSSLQAGWFSSYRDRR